MSKLVSLLEGKKTYLSCLAGAVIVVLLTQDLISAELAHELLILVGFGGLAALRRAVNKIDK